jgi:hypothetical protein
LRLVEHTDLDTAHGPSISRHVIGFIPDIGCQVITTVFAAAIHNKTKPNNQSATCPPETCHHILSRISPWITTNKQREQCP